MWETNYQLGKKFVCIGGKWFDPQSVVAAVDELYAGVGSVRVYLSSGAEITIESSSNTSSDMYNFNAYKFIHLLKDLVETSS